MSKNQEMILGMWRIWTIHSYQLMLILNVVSKPCSMSLIHIIMSHTLVIVCYITDQIK
jgi:hypothetical protein